MTLIDKEPDEYRIDPRDVWLFTEQCKMLRYQCITLCCVDEAIIRISKNIISPQKTVMLFFPPKYNYYGWKRMVSSSGHCYLHVLLLHGLGFWTSGDLEWSLTSTGNNWGFCSSSCKIHVPNMKSSLLRYCFGSLMPCDLNWPLASTKNTIVTNMCIKYETCGSLLQYLEISTGMHPVLSGRMSSTPHPQHLLICMYAPAGTYTPSFNAIYPINNPL